MLGRALLASFLIGCAGVDEVTPAVAPPPEVGEPDPEALSPIDGLHEGYPDPTTLPGAFSRVVYPAVHAALVVEQSPVKSQGSRGVCSIFSAVAHMEHMYARAGMPAPDFSEQFLQWSVKYEVYSLPWTPGSSSYYNLQALRWYGIPVESVWPYELAQWGPDDHPSCDAELYDPLPTYCFTNGSPTAAMLEADRYRLPSRRWVSVLGNGIKQEIVASRGVIVSLPVFYQSWNHRLSPLVINDDYKALGYVLYPNADDVDESSTPDLAAGHSVYVVGWDDDLEVPKRDANGDVVVNASGNPVTEKGFYLFKNSWGTSSWGRDNPFGAGYGYLSYRYVRDYGDAYSTGVPSWSP